MNTLFTGEQLRDAGIELAVNHANAVTPKWSDVAYSFLVSYILSHKVFMIEEVRAASHEVVPVPPSARAWGGVVRRAVKSKLIVRKGFRQVKNAKAHCTPATVWETV